MNEVISYIDEFFKGSPGPNEKKEFEKRLKEDPAFAEEVAFYVATINVLKEDAKSERRERFRNFKSDETSEEASESTNVRPMRNSRRLSWMYAAAASVLILLTVGWFVFGDRATPVEMADRYIKEKLTDVGGEEMGINQDRMQTGLSLFNKGKLNEALPIFESIERELENLDDSSQVLKAKETEAELLPEAKKMIGLVYLRLGQYDKALDYFKQLENFKNLRVNPGKFYQAIALLKRNRAGDSDLAKNLLEQVDVYGLDGSDEARKILKTFK